MRKTLRHYEAVWRPVNVKPSDTVNTKLKGFKT